MKSLTNQLVGLSFLIILIFTGSCKKSIFLDDRNDKHTVIFNLSGFSTSQTELPKISSKLASNQPASLQSYHEGVLYYWSFNNEDIVPEVKYQSSLSPVISYNDNLIPDRFVNSTYTYETYTAGKALTITGPRELIFKMPIKNIPQLKHFGFDIGSSNGGPKTFDIFYSLDNGVSFIEYVLDNQFNSFGANVKQSYNFDLESLEVETVDAIVFKLVFSAGERGTSGAYNASTGTIRLDNVFLKGLIPFVENTHVVNKAHYYFFNRLTNKLTSGTIPFERQAMLALDLEFGHYDYFIVSNNSVEELIIPEEVTKNSLSLSNYFRNSKAEIFGHVGELVVDEPSTTNLSLGRLYSQIKIEFTDPVSLSDIERIVVKQNHHPFQYFPFLSSATSSLVDPSTIVFSEDFDANKQVVFNQFMGKLSTAKALSYTIEVYSADDLIRTFDLGSTLMHNMQLVFRGNLLLKTTAHEEFDIIRNENWDGQESENF